MLRVARAYIRTYSSSAEGCLPCTPMIASLAVASGAFQPHKGGNQDAGSQPCHAPTVGTPQSAGMPFIPFSSLSIGPIYRFPRLKSICPDNHCPLECHQHKSKSRPAQTSADWQRPSLTSVPMHLHPACKSMRVNGSGAR